MYFFGLEFVRNVRKDLRQHPANVETETGTRVEAVEQARRDDSSKSIQSPSS